MDGLAWSLPLDRLWEDHVARKVQEQVRQEGGVLRLGRRGETVTPLHWSDPTHRSLGHLVPDMVVTRRSSVWIGTVLGLRNPAAPQPGIAMAQDASHLLSGGAIQ